MAPAPVSTWRSSSRPGIGVPHSTPCKLHRPFPCLSLRSLPSTFHARPSTSPPAFAGQDRVSRIQNRVSTSPPAFATFCAIPRLRHPTASFPPLANPPLACRIQDRVSSIQRIKVQSNLPLRKSKCDQGENQSESKWNQTKSKRIKVNQTQKFFRTHTQTTEY